MTGFEGWNDMRTCPEDGTPLDVLVTYLQDNSLRVFRDCYWGSPHGHLVLFQNNHLGLPVLLNLAGHDAKVTHWRPRELQHVSIETRIEPPLTSAQLERFKKSVELKAQHQEEIARYKNLVAELRLAMVKLAIPCEAQSISAYMRSKELNASMQEGLEAVRRMVKPKEWESQDDE